LLAQVLKIAQVALQIITSILASVIHAIFSFQVVVNVQRLVAVCVYQDSIKMVTNA